ncbi:MAG TPA: RluA family pseudouridine synthase [bacterium]|nr:RluA family pseudouridine synthase [bacterium]
MEPSSLSAQSNNWTVQAGEGGQRLDVFLASHLPSFSRNQVQNLIKEGHVTPLFAAKPLKASLPVTEGQAFRVVIPASKPSEIPAQSLPLDIVFEDDHLLVLNKPAGLVVHPGAGNPDSTLINALVAHCPEIAGVGGVQRPGLVHRLDKDTSGLLAVAKTDLAYRSLVKQIRYRQMSREYLGLVKGKVTEPGLIDAAIGRHVSARKKMAVQAEGGKSAKTHFVPLSANDEASLLHLKLETGRTHQIRVHLQFIHHPILGDVVYGSSHGGFGRQMLHAFRLSFQHPKTGKALSFFAPPPEDLTAAVQALGLAAPVWKDVVWKG